MQISSGWQLYERALADRPIVTMSQDVDRLLGGGVRMGRVTDICGLAGAGKTQLACVMLLLFLFMLEYFLMFCDSVAHFWPTVRADRDPGL